MSSLEFVCLSSAQVGSVVLQGVFVALFYFASLFMCQVRSGVNEPPLFAGKDATEEFDMLHDRKVIKKYGIDEGTVVLKGTIKK